MDLLKKNELIQTQEIEELINLLKNTSEYDLSRYRKASLKRRIERFLIVEKMSFLELKSALINAENFNKYFIQELSVVLTEMFRNPIFFQELNNVILPKLNDQNFIRIWSAGTGTGEEAYSIAILLKINNLLDKSFIYATDINQKAINIAKKGIYSLKKIKAYTKNYNNTLLTTDFSSHFTAMYNASIMNYEYRNKILFSIHNLVTDHAFNEFHIILCRNVLIYFETDLQERVLHLFYESLAQDGYLCLGSRENFMNHSISKYFRVIDKTNNIYQKIA